MPLVIDNEFEIDNEKLLAEYVGRIVLGHFAHVKRIIKALSTKNLVIDNSDLELAIIRLSCKEKSPKDIEKRDGWIFQIISWLALLSENKGKNFYCQPPHDATAQHGLDGLAIILNDQLIIESIIITEDKCTDYHRTLIPKVWEEFEQFESGFNNNKLVNRVSPLIEEMNEGKVLERNQNNIYNKSLRRYRVGINRNDTYQAHAGHLKLFKGYDSCVTGTVPHRRYASTIHRNDIRTWMEMFSQKVIEYLETQIKKDV